MTTLLVDGTNDIEVRGPEGLVIMLQQICRDYHSLPPIRSITIAEIMFFYNGLRADLKRTHGN